MRKIAFAKFYLFGTREHAFEKKIIFYYDRKPLSQLFFRKKDKKK